MPRWLRIVRGAVGTGLTFAAGVAAIASAVSAVVWLGGGTPAGELAEMIGKFTVVSFLLGVGFSGVLAIAARGREFSKLSVRLISGLGAGAGLLYFTFLAFNGGRNWSAKDAIANLVTLTVMGAGAAAVTLLVARRAKTALHAGDELQSLNAGDEVMSRERSSAKVGVPRD